AQIERRWYLLAWCRLRSAGRWFRLDRINRVVATGEVFPLRDVRDVFGEPPPEAYTLSLFPDSP
ncbi:MAG: WYL domain-containing protein, partial [Spirochaetales bacterium]|nr:WYL domain-containing protein [Spirochaetales bacterium]